jgi:hypothetical protein
MHHSKYDPAMEKLKPGTKVGIVGESHVWDGPLDQAGRSHGEGSSSGISGMQILKAPCRTCESGIPITKRAKLG